MSNDFKTLAVMLGAVAGFLSRAELHGELVEAIRTNFDPEYVKFVRDQLTQVLVDAGVERSPLQ